MPGITCPDIMHSVCIAPVWYHGGRSGSYTGDRHPEDYVYEHPEAFEPTPRKCGNCGEVTLCLKKEWLQG
jgi:hypothetical protein